MSKFTVSEAMKGQKALREAAGQSEEYFEVEQVVGMLSDEIRALREKGMTDEKVAQILESVGMKLSAAEIGKYYIDTRGIPGHGHGHGH